MILLLLVGLTVAILTPYFWLGFILAAFAAGRLSHRQGAIEFSPRRPAREIDLSVRRQSRG